MTPFLHAATDAEATDTIETHGLLQQRLRYDLVGCDANPLAFRLRREVGVVIDMSLAYLVVLGEPRWGRRLRVTLADAVWRTPSAVSTELESHCSPIRCDSLHVVRV